MICSGTACTLCGRKAGGSLIDHFSEWRVTDVQSEPLPGDRSHDLCPCRDDGVMGRGGGGGGEER